jgi:SAM-dependent methyltransferase
VGTGTGFLAGIAARLGHDVTAIDLSTGMLDASTLRDTGLPITFAVGDAVNPAFPVGSFDAIISRSLIWTLREPVTAFRNWHRLLRPGGRVLAIYGLAPAAPPDEGNADREPGVFERYYTREIQAGLPAMRLTDLLHSLKSPLRLDSAMSPPPRLTCCADGRPRQAPTCRALSLVTEALMRSPATESWFGDSARTAAAEGHQDCAATTPRLSTARSGDRVNRSVTAGRLILKRRRPRA